MNFPLDAKDQEMLRQLKQAALRHKGMVRARIARLLLDLRVETLTMDQLATIRQEWLRLGLHEKKGGANGGG